MATASDSRSSNVENAGEMFASEALPRFVDETKKACAFYPPNQIRWVLEIGPGRETRHADAFAAAGLTVHRCSFSLGCNFPSSLFNEDTDRIYDGIWASHVLEHADNVQTFLRGVRRYLRPEGVFGVTVPPAKHNIVGGHLTIWNAGLLLYNLVVAGFDCRDARVGTYGYNISVIVRHRAVPHTELKSLVRDTGDIERLSKWFPVYGLRQGFDGRLENCNW